MRHGRRRVGQHLLGVVDLAARESLQSRDLVQRQVGEEPQETTHVRVLGVPPELPIIIGFELVGVEPHGAGSGLAHLGAVRSEEHTSELQSLMRISYAVFCLKKKHLSLNRQKY